MAHSALFPDRAGLFEASKKVTVIRLRWLIVIVSSYLLVFPQASWLDVGIIVFYVLTNIGLYFVDQGRFEASYFYSPLVVFDTLFVTATLVISGQVGTDFYLAYFLVVILCTIWQDFRALLVVAALSTLLYGYFLFRTAELYDQSVYLRIPFLFIIWLFYGYFAQLARREKVLKEQAEQEAQDMAMIQTLSQSLPTSLDYQQILATLGDKINQVVHADNFYVFIEDEDQGPSRALLFSGTKTEAPRPIVADLQEYPFIQECLKSRNPVIRQMSSPGFIPVESQGRSEELLTRLVMAVPIIFREETLGAICLGFNDKNRVFTPREIQFCQIVAFATAVALVNAKKYEELKEEARRRQIIADELAQADSLKSEYLANTSHELRTPIATIMGYGNLLVDGTCGRLGKAHQRAIERLMENARRLLELVDQILDYSKFEKGERGLYVKRQDLGTFLKGLREELTPLEAKRPYKVQYILDDSIPPIETDWGKLRSILINLLSNAIKFTDEGEVKLSVTNGSDKKELFFKVSDTGIGIPKDHIPLIFDKFRQVDGSTAKRYEGTGLGLTITKNLVELLGGRIEVDSKIGEGSTFSVTLPFRS
ncbi:MAG: GAF domain-containing sensor histidine kinase [Candidatus Binatia bacterium]